MRLPTKSPKHKSTGRTNPALETKAAPLEESVTSVRGSPSARTTRKAPSPPAETPDRSEDEAEPSPRQGARARKQTARATESWALKKAKEKADKAKQNHAPSIEEDSIPRTKIVAGKRRIHYDRDEADKHINTEADSRKLAYDEEPKRMMNNKKRGSMWPAEDSYDDGRLPDTEDDEKAMSTLAASNSPTSLPTKKTLKRVTKRQSLMKENYDADMDDDEIGAMLYEPKSTKNGTRKAKRRKVTIDLEDEEEIVASNLSSGKKPTNRAMNGAFAAAERRQKRCYGCQTPESRPGGGKRKHFGVAAKELCSACSEKSSLAIMKELKGSLILEAKGRIKASQSKRHSIEESSSRSRKTGDKETGESVGVSGDEAVKQKKTARDKSLEKARAVKAQKTYKSKVSAPSPEPLNLSRRPQLNHSTVYGKPPKPKRQLSDATALSLRGHPRHRIRARTRRLHSQLRQQRAGLRSHALRHSRRTTPLPPQYWCWRRPHHRAAHSRRIRRQNDARQLRP